MNGVWILAIVVYGARHEVTLIPYQIYDSWQLCNAWKARESKEIGLPLTCIREGDA